MLTRVGRRRRKKKREEEESGDSQSRTTVDQLSDPLQQREADPLRESAMQDQLMQEAKRFAQKQDAKDDQRAEVQEEVDEVLDDLLEESSLDADEINAETLAEGELELDEIQELMDLDHLGALMTTLGTYGALDEEDPIVEAIIEDDLEEAVEASTTGFANAFVTPEKMIDNEIQSQRRPMDDADTKMQVTPMSWVPNRVKVPIGRRAMDEPLVDRGLNHEVKEDVSTRDEDHDFGTRSRRRHTPLTPTADQVMAGMGATNATIELNDFALITQTYHETMQSVPDFAKTFVLGQFRMLERWVNAEEPRIDLAEGTTPIEWMQENLLPNLIADMKNLQSFFDYDHDMIFYRQWLSEALRVKRKAD